VDLTEPFKKEENMDEQNRWLSWAIELQSLAQAGLTYPLSAANSFRISKRPKQNISAETNCRRISLAKRLRASRY